MTLYSSPKRSKPMNWQTAVYRMPSECGKRTRRWMSIFVPSHVASSDDAKSPDPSRLSPVARSNGEQKYALATWAR
jgi:hypothetical protein